METRGRESELEREVASVIRIADVRPDPPPFLDADEATEWRRIVNNMPAGWYKDSYYGDLVAYCQKLVEGLRMTANAKLVEDKYGEGWPKYKEFTKGSERCYRAVDKFGTTLRITAQSRYDREKAARDSNKNQTHRGWGPKQ
jgi:phage terminase small subunit